jgi:radical SAM superfamily enzyme YgiQ (UPF0313 family)
MKIVFLNPNSRATTLAKFPIGMAYLSSVIKANGYPDVKGYQSTEPDWRDGIKDAKLVCIHVTTITFIEAIAIAKDIKASNPKATIIAGGPHATLKPEDFFKRSTDFDYVIRGEAEQTILDVILHTLIAKPKPQEINGITYKDGDNIISTPDRERPQNLDAIPFPDRTLFKNSIQRYPFYASTDILAGRSCIYNCSNCQPALRKIMGIYRIRSVKNVVDEIKELIDMGVTKLNFNDNSLTHNAKWTEEFCNTLIKENIKIRWGCCVCEREVTPDLLKLMHKAGCINIQFGVESGSQRVLDEILNKKVTLDHVRKVVDWCNEIGMGVHNWYMMAIPGETREEAMETITFATSLNINSASFHISSPNPLTGYERVANENGWNRSKGYGDLDNLDRKPMMVTPEYGEDYVKYLDKELELQFTKKGWEFIHDKHSYLFVNSKKELKENPVGFLGAKIIKLIGR